MPSEGLPVHPWVLTWLTVDYFVSWNQLDLKGTSAQEKTLLDHVTRMCYVVVTSRTLLWTLLTMATTLAMVAAVITPTWLVGPSRRLRSRQKGNTDDEIFTPSLGLYNGCIKVHEIDQLFTENCAPFVTSFGMSSEDFPNFWKAALILFVCGLGLLAITLLTSLSCCCIKSVMRKSVFTVSGTMQAIAGILFVFGLLLYPAGWGSRRIQMVCSSKAGPYNIGDCALGWTYYLAIIGTIVTFICSLLSVQAEMSTTSSKVQDGLLEGKNVICLMWKSSVLWEILVLKQFLQILLLLSRVHVTSAPLSIQSVCWIEPSRISFFVVYNQPSRRYRKTLEEKIKFKLH